MCGLLLLLSGEHRLADDALHRFDSCVLLSSLTWTQASCKSLVCGRALTRFLGSNPHPPSAQPLPTPPVAIVTLALFTAPAKSSALCWQPL